jgi:hypothetical protein
VKYLSYNDTIPNWPAIPYTKHYLIEVEYNEEWGPLISIVVLPYFTGVGWLSDEMYEFEINPTLGSKIPEFKRFPIEVRKSILTGIMWLLDAKVLIHDLKREEEKNRGDV